MLLAQLLKPLDRLLHALVWAVDMSLPIGPCADPCHHYRVLPAPVQRSVFHLSTFHLGLTDRDSEFAHRLSALEPLPKEVADLRQDFAVLKKEVSTMTDAFQSLKTALYAAAGTILSAAVLVVLLGRAA